MRLFRYRFHLALQCTESRIGEIQSALELVPLRDFSSGLYFGERATFEIGYFEQLRNFKSRDWKYEIHN